MTNTPPSITRRHRAAAALLTLALVATATVAAAGPAAAAKPTVPEPGSTYVALGSSYAAGAGLQPADPTDTAGLCGRALSTYPNIVANALGLRLVNVSCGGATIDNVVNTPQQLAGQDGTRVADPQISAVDSTTRLVTITIGGNDVSYVSNLIAESCRADLAQNPQSPFSNLLLSFGTCNLTDEATVNAALEGLRGEFEGMIQAIRARAPQARIVLVDYLTVLPRNGKPCTAIPIPQDKQRFLLKVADKVNLATRVAAQRTGVEYIAASKLSRDHDACSAQPWVTGYVPSANLMHPRQEGHAAIADAVLRQLQRPSRQG